MLQLLLAILTTLVLWTAYSLWIKKQPTPNPNDSQRSSQTEQQQPKQQISSEPVTKPEPKQETTTTEQPQIIQPTPSGMYNLMCNIIIFFSNGYICETSKFW